MGQHFLTDTSVLRQIVETANISRNDTVLEIGPGKGTLTLPLAESAKQVIAVEKDAQFIDLLRDILPKNVTLIHGDILDTETQRELFDYISGDYAIVANIPYYVTGKIFHYFFEDAPRPPTSMTLLVQYEVATRILGALLPKGKESILSLAVKAYGKPTLVKKVPPGAFHKPPKVDSAILHISDISKTFFTTHNISEKDFFALVKKGFSSKRKKLRNTLGKHIEETAFANKRPEELSIEDWATILVDSGE